MRRSDSALAALIVLVASAGLAPRSAHAQMDWVPRSALRDAAIAFENDNKWLGVYQAIAEDGTDLGRTHRMSFRYGQAMRRGWRWAAILDSELFTAQLYGPNGRRLNTRPDGTLHPDFNKDRNIYFQELTTFRGLIEGEEGALRGGFTWVVGFGGIVSNQQARTPFATGQQWAFHSFLGAIEERTKEYRYLDNGAPLRGGVVADAGVRHRLHLWSGARGRVTSIGRGNFRANTLRHGSHAAAMAGVIFGAGEVRHHDQSVAEFQLRHGLELYVGTGHIVWRSGVEALFHARRFTFALTHDAYYGDRHLAYFVYNGPNTSTVARIGIRMGGPRLAARIAPDAN